MAEPTDDEATSLLRPSTRVYKRRWYILLIFSLVAILQDTIWNTWGPIDHTAKFLYNWSDDLIALLANYGSIMYIAAFVPAVYLLEKSLRGAMLMTTGLMALGTILRCGFLQDPYVSDQVFTISCHICSILNGISNIVIGSAPLAISAAWFPQEERVTATSVAQVANGLGTGMSFLLASQMVRPIDHYINNASSPADLPPKVLADLKSDIQWYMYAQAIPAGLFFMMTLAYFPTSPAKPPSLSSSESRLDFKAGFIEVLKNKTAWAIAIGSSIPQGILIAWTAMMVINLTQVCSASGAHCLTQHWVNYLGIQTSIVSTVAAVLVARLSDKFKGQLKLILVILLFLACVIFSFLTLVSLRIFYFKHLVNVEISVLFLMLSGSSLVVASMPISMELAMEACYPAGEGVVGAFISIWFNISTIIFLSLYNVPGIGVTWLHYILPFTCLAALPFILFIKVEYKRLQIDANSEESREEENLSL